MDAASCSAMYSSISLVSAVTGCSERLEILVSLERDGGVVEARPEFGVRGPYSEVFDGPSEVERLFDDAESIDEPDCERIRFLLIVSIEGDGAGDGKAAITLGRLVVSPEEERCHLARDTQETRVRARQSDSS